MNDSTHSDKPEAGDVGWATVSKGKKDVTSPFSSQENLHRNPPSYRAGGQKRYGEKDRVSRPPISTVRALSAPIGAKVQHHRNTEVAPPPTPAASSSSASSAQFAWGGGRTAPFNAPSTQNNCAGFSFMDKAEKKVIDVRDRDKWPGNCVHNNIQLFLVPYLVF